MPPRQMPSAQSCPCPTPLQQPRKPKGADPQSTLRPQLTTPTSCFGAVLLACSKGVGGCRAARLLGRRAACWRDGRQAGLLAVCNFACGALKGGGLACATLAFSLGSLQWGCQRGCSPGRLGGRPSHPGRRRSSRRCWSWSRLQQRASAAWRIRGNCQHTVKNSLKLDGQGQAARRPGQQRRQRAGTAGHARAAAPPR